MFGASPYVKLSLAPRDAFQLDPHRTLFPLMTPIVGNAGGWSFPGLPAEDPLCECELVTMMPSRPDAGWCLWAWRLSYVEFYRPRSIGGHSKSHERWSATGACWLKVPYHFKHSPSLRRCWVFEVAASPDIVVPLPTQTCWPEWNIIDNSCDSSHITSCGAAALLWNKAESRGRCAFPSTATSHLQAEQRGC